MNKLSVCAEMVYEDLPFEERMRVIADKGFGVDIWSYWTHDVDAIVKTGIPVESTTGYIHGNLAIPEDSEQMIATAKQILPTVKRLGAKKLVIHGAELVDGKAAKPIDVVTPAMWLNAYDTLRKFADLGEKEGVTYVLENLNHRVDHPHVPFGLPSETITLVKAVDSPNLKLMLDLYHAQTDAGHLIDTITEAGQYIGELQVADVPGRMEPGTGEVNWAAVGRAAVAAGYTGTIGMEAFASGSSDAALEAFRSAFSE